jgi:hypothetical protein
MPLKTIKTIVFLPIAAADFVVAHLKEARFDAVGVHTPRELWEAMHSCNYSLAVTNRPDIDIVRRIQLIPVINIEVFFDVATGPHQDGSTRRFDAKSLIRRVHALTNTDRAEGETEVANPNRTSDIPLVANSEPARNWASKFFSRGHSPSVGR